MKVVVYERFMEYWGVTNGGANPLHEEKLVPVFKRLILGRLSTHHIRLGASTSICVDSLAHSRHPYHINRALHDSDLQKFRQYKCLQS